MKKLDFLDKNIFLKRLGYFVPEMDISEDNEFVIIRVNLPGVKIEDIDIKFENRTLIISGIKNKPHYKEIKNFHRLEREFGIFKKIIKFKSIVTSSNIDAKLTKGVLKIKVKKVENKFEIKVK